MAVLVLFYTCYNPLHHFKGAQSAPGLGCRLILEASRRPHRWLWDGAASALAGWRDWGTAVRRLPSFAPSGHVSAVAHSVPGIPPHGHLAATLAVAPGAARAAIPPVPDPEALQDRGQGRAFSASLA